MSARVGGSFVEKAVVANTPMVVKNTNTKRSVNSEPLPTAARIFMSGFLSGKHIFKNAKFNGVCYLFTPKSNFCQETCFRPPLQK
jgi:hypothetical protein